MNGTVNGLYDGIDNGASNGLYYSVNTGIDSGLSSNEVSMIPNIVRSGLLVYLEAANILSYPKSGILWKDLSGNLRNGILSGSTADDGPTFSPINGGSFLFDGVNDHVGFNLPALSVFSFAVFFKITTIPAGERKILTTLDDQQAISIRNSRIFAWPSAMSSSFLPTTNTWYYVVITASAADGTKMYINGFLDQSSAGLGRSITAGLATLGVFLRDRNFFPGTIISCKFYNRILSLNEVSQNYNVLKKYYKV